MIIDNTLNRTNDNYTQSLPVTISFIRTTTIRLFQKPVGNTTSKSVPKTSLEIASFCSDFNERPCLLESEFETSNLSIRASHLSLCPERGKNVRMTFKWHIWNVIDSWSLTAPIRNSVRGRTEFWKITMTSGVILHLPTPPLSLFLTNDRPHGTAFSCH